MIKSYFDKKKDPYFTHFRRKFGESMLEDERTARLDTEN